MARSSGLCQREFSGDQCLRTGGTVSQRGLSISTPLLEPDSQLFSGEVNPTLRMGRKERVCSMLDVPALLRGGSESPLS